MRYERLHKLVWQLKAPTAMLSLVSLILYTSYRLRCLWKFQQASGTVLISSWLFVSLEILTFVPDILLYTLRIIATQRPRRGKYRLVGSTVPTVDILITCCNEDIDLVINTVRAACVLDYPEDRYRVFLCDDGASQELQNAVENLPFNHVFYHARVKSLIKDYKAGNLNAGLAFSRSIPLQCSTSKASQSPNSLKNLSKKANHLSKSFGSPRTIEVNFAQESASNHKEWLNTKTVTHLPLEHDVCSTYIAGLDADMIPEPHWLRALLPHIIHDKKTAMACPPQTFYDIPENDLLTQTMDHFSGIIETLNDSLGHADCLGSGYVMRRRAIESIGGFPTESLSEDVCCSATLLGAGWKTVFVHETLQYGSVPESFFAHVKQRTRWFVGHVQTALLFNLRFFGTRGKYLNLRQKFAGLAFDLGQIVQVPTLMAYFILPWALIAGNPVITFSNTQDLKGLINRVVIWQISHWVHQSVIGLIAGLGNELYDVRIPSYGPELDQWLAPYIGLSFLRSFVLPERWGGKKVGFTSTGSLKNDLNERNSRHRAPLHRRLYVTMIDHHLIFHVAFLTICLAGIGLTLLRSKVSSVLLTSKTRASGEFHPRGIDSRNLDQLIYVVLRIGWPPLTYFRYMASVMGPITYMIFPPTTPGRDVLLALDEKTGVHYPKREFRQPRRNFSIVWRYLRPALAMIHIAGMLTLCKAL